MMKRQAVTKEERIEMRKKAIFILQMAFCGLILSYSAAFADIPVHMVDAIGKNNPEDFRDGGIFQTSETPYLYFNIPVLPSLTFGGSYWLNPDNNIFFTMPAFIMGNDVWLTLDWDIVAKLPGEWSAEEWYTSPFTPGDKGQTTFRYAPEPISTALFLIGGAMLAVRRFGNRKRNIHV